MNKTRQIIDDNKDKFPEFQYYHNIIDKIEENIEKMPDITIESCKSLVEGVSKGILKYLKEEYKQIGRKDGSTQNYLKRVLKKVSKNSKVDIEFIRSTANFVKRIAEIRNERGDISHGKAAPKEAVSDKHLAGSIAHITDGLVCYLLSIFFDTDWSYLEEVKYEKNDEFNQFLDDGLEIEGVTYSKALFDQDPISYKQQLENYLSSD